MRKHYTFWNVEDQVAAATKQELENVLQILRATEINQEEVTLTFKYCWILDEELIEALNVYPSHQRRVINTFWHKPLMTRDFNEDFDATTVFDLEELKRLIRVSDPELRISRVFGGYVTEDEAYYVNVTMRKKSLVGDIKRLFTLQ